MSRGWHRLSQVDGRLGHQQGAGLIDRLRRRRHVGRSARQWDKLARARAAAVEELMADQRAARSGFEAAYRRTAARR